MEIAICVGKEVAKEVVGVKRYSPVEGNKGTALRAAEMMLMGKVEAKEKVDVVQVAGLGKTIFRKLAPAAVPGSNPTPTPAVASPSVSNAIPPTASLERICHIFNSANHITHQ